MRGRLLWQAVRPRRECQLLGEPHGKQHAPGLEPSGGGLYCEPVRRPRESRRSPLDAQAAEAAARYDALGVVVKHREGCASPSRRQAPRRLAWMVASVQKQAERVFRKVILQG